MSKKSSRKGELKKQVSKEIIEEIILEKFVKLMVMNFQIGKASTMNENRPTLRPITMKAQKTTGKKKIL